MDNAWKLPEEIEITGVNYPIRTDYRAILDILMAQTDTELTDQEKAQVMLEILYLHPEQISPENLEEACQKAVEFIDCGIKSDGKPKPRLMDWKQDAPVIVPAINKVIGTEVRAVKYLHWWSFMGAYLEIEESLFSQILSVRQKKLKGKKLEKWEQEFYKANKSLIDLKSKAAPKRSQEEKDAIRELLGLK